jgi:Family of unknown function (DUF6519)
LQRTALMTETSDVIGTSGAPRDNAGFQIQQLPQPGLVWAPNTFFAQGAEIFDPNGSVEIAIAAGTSGANAPSWPTTVGNTVPDGSSGLTWQLVGSDLTISPGRIYVGGLLCELNEGTTYMTQPDYPEPPWLPTIGVIIAYLDVWERPITALEDPQILEVALGG